MAEPELIELAYEDLLRNEEAEGALLFRIEGLDRWIPRTLLYEWDEDASTIAVPEWFAVKEGLV